MYHCIGCLPSIDALVDIDRLGYRNSTDCCHRLATIQNRQPICDHYCSKELDDGLSPTSWVRLDWVQQMTILVWEVIEGSGNDTAAWTSWSPAGVVPIDLIELGWVQMDTVVGVFKVFP